MINYNLSHHHSAGPRKPETFGLLRRQSVKRRRSAQPAIEPLEGRALLSAGALDTTFGGTGMVTTAIGPKASLSEAVATQSDSKVVVAGWSWNSTAKFDQFSVARYNTNGTLDTTFGSKGIAVVPIGNYNYADQAYAVAVQPTDGKILVAGYADIYDKKTAAWYSDWAVVRLNTDGSLDKTFGGTGYVTTRLTPEIWMGENVPDSIVVQPNGQIVVGGWLGGVSTSGTVQGMALVRYNTNGSLDTTFGAGGKVISAGVIYNTFGPGTIAIDSSGRIDVAGQSTVGSGGPIVTRYLANGTLDSSFGTAGVAGPLPVGVANGVALQSTGKIVVYGNSLVRLNTDGTLDTTFGANGVYSDSRMPSIASIVVQPADDEIVAAGGGLVNGKGDQNFWVTRVLAGGSAYDSTFGTNGLSEANFHNPLGESGPTSVALDPNGNILVTGVIGTYSYFETARFLGDSTSTPSVLPLTAGPSTTTPSGPDPILGALVLNDPSFLDSLTSHKHRRLN